MKEWCIFCAIAQWKFDSTAVIRESDTHIAFLWIFPNTEWMSVVIPKEHLSSDCLNLTDTQLTELVLAAKQAAKKLENAYEDVWRVGLIMEWTGVDHAHMKLYPMHHTRSLQNWSREKMERNEKKWFEIYEWYMTSLEGKRVDDEALKKLAERISSS